MSLKRTKSVLTTIGLSIALLACATAKPPPPPPELVPVAVQLREDPPSDLLACAERPAGLPAVDGDKIQASARAALERVFPKFGENASRLDRWVNWFAPGSCPPPDG